MMTQRYTKFSEWMSDCLEIGLDTENLTTDYSVYEFTQEGDVVAYWDREAKIGSICNEVFEHA